MSDALGSGRPGSSQDGEAGRPEPLPAPSAASVPVCATCGTSPADDESTAQARLTWSRGTENGREVWTCDPCSRRHLRSIEGKLDSAWW